MLADEAYVLPKISKHAGVLNLSRVSARKFLSTFLGNQSCKMSVCTWRPRQTARHSLPKTLLYVSATTMAGVSTRSKTPYTVS